MVDVPQNNKQTTNKITKGVRIKCVREKISWAQGNRRKGPLEMLLARLDRESRGNLPWTTFRPSKPRLYVEVLKGVPRS